MGVTLRKVEERVSHRGAVSQSGRRSTVSGGRSCCAGVPVHSAARVRFHACSLVERRLFRESLLCEMSPLI